jgi:AcrR family transcriptional regulator
MRYEKGHKELAKAHILDVASKRFRKEGVAAVGLATVMSDAGLTNGAFYNHFDSKEALVRDVLAATMDKRRDNTLQLIQGGGDGMAAAIRGYLSVAHRDNPELGCPSASLMPEIGRHPGETRALYTARIKEFVALIASNFKNPDEVTRHQQATALFGLLVGTVQLARAVSDEAMSNSILEGGLKTALALLAEAA